jgi:CheY-like chemotaxis protein
MSRETPTINLLLVDDSPVAATATDWGLDTAPASIQLRIAGDRVEASRYLCGADLYADRTAYPVPDVILLGINIPHCTDLEFLRWLRQHAPADARSIPVIIVSSCSVPEELEEARSLGARMLVPRPVNWPELLNELLAAGVLSAL